MGACFATSHAQCSRFCPDTATVGINIQPPCLQHHCVGKAVPGAVQQMLAKQFNRLVPYAAVTHCLGTPPPKTGPPPSDITTHILRQLTTIQAVAEVMLNLVEVETMSPLGAPFPRPRKSYAAPYTCSTTSAPTCSSGKQIAGQGQPVPEASHPGVCNHTHQSAGPSSSQQQQQFTPAAIQDHLHASLATLAALEWVLHQHRQHDLAQSAGLMSERLLQDTLWTLLELLHDLLVPHLAHLSVDMANVSCLAASVLLRCVRFTNCLVAEQQLRDVAEPLLGRLATCYDITRTHARNAFSMLWPAWESCTNEVGEHQTSPLYVQ